MKKPTRPHISHLDDGCTLIEFIWKRHRIGIAIEKDLKESSWYYVSKHGTSESGLIFKQKDDVDIALTKTANEAFNNIYLPPELVKKLKEQETK
jgi:hypothetical protein